MSPLRENVRFETLFTLNPARPNRIALICGVVGTLIFGLARGVDTPVACAAEVSQKPNVVFVLVDDLGFADVGFNGSTFYETPNIDRLAKEGLVFEYAYMYPTCSPSRAALATGKQSFRTGVYTVPVLEKGSDRENLFSRWTVGEEHTMYSEPLADAGYRSIHLGKWHLVGPYPQAEMAASFPLKKKLGQPSPSDFSWVEYHKSEACRKYYPEGRGYLKNVAGTYRGDPALEVGGYDSETGGYFAPFSNPFLEQKPDDEWLTDRLTDEAIEFMDVHKEGPFFINLHYYTVHRPLRARSQSLLEKYLNKSGDPVTGQGTNTGKQKVLEAEYATMIESLDDNIGRIEQFLVENGLRENTLIIFTSDNGQNGRSNDLLRESKGHIYEGGIRVPTFINWPGKINPRRTEVPIMGLDFFPTFMDLAGIDYDGVLDGQSITPLFQADDAALKERPLFWHLASQYKHGTCSVIRKGSYKLIQFLATGKLELYDLGRDPKEEHNLAATQPETAERLLAELVQWRHANDVPLPPNAVVEN
ncbi:sulfatase [Rhodopirellula sp. SWK7]|uniref:sulfatase n=1 Tax=Rhodopirellula sp. SWK7 TaxID=595460 RepID=UPI0002C016FF|nr:sulfatase [Rhodopirellula sp. SWK7]EMI43504.1 arylsulfatase [Rhodopirellula sp. SWK7]